MTKEMQPLTLYPYRNFVEKLRLQWHQVRHLIDFMHKDESNRHPFRVAVLDFDDCEGVILRNEFTLVWSLSTFLDRDPPKSSRLLIVEDPSTDLIEMLGSRYDVDPEFFSVHVVNHHWYGMCSSVEMIPSSKGTIQEQSFLRLRYLEARRVKLVKQERAEHISFRRHPQSSRNARHSVLSRRKRLTDQWTESFFTGPASNVKCKVSVMSMISAHTPIGIARHHLTTWMKITGPESWIGKYSS